MWHRGLLIGGAALAAVAAPVQAQDARQPYSIEEQQLGSALRAFAAASGRDVIADSRLVAGKRSRALRGSYGPDAALAQLLRRTGLRAELVDGAFVIRPDDRNREGNATATDIVVVGTRIRGSAPVGAPVTTLDRAALDRSGRGTVQGLLETIPSNFGGGLNEGVVGTTSRNNAGDNIGFGSSINLRGLGPSSTLVLFDGNRPALGGVTGTFADVSLIPQLAIEGIDILTDGASAVYGSDAVAGVVNFRFRNRFSGAETWARAGTAEGDFSEFQLGQLAGARWTTGGLVVSYQYSGRGALSGAQRDYATDDLRPFGGGDFRSLYAAPGTIVAADGSIFAIPANQDGRDLRPDQLISGQSNLRDDQQETDLLPRQQSHALYAAIDQELNDGVEVYVRSLFAKRKARSNRGAASETPTVVPVTNAYYVDPIGTGLPVRVRYDFGADLGREFRVGEVEGLSTTAGLVVDLGSWRAELNGSYGRHEEEQGSFNLVNRARLTSTLADPDPATAYNLFGDGFDTNPATIDRVRGSSIIRSRSVVWSAALRADGSLFALPAGDVRLAVGAEHRDERQNTTIANDTRGLLPTVSDFPGLPNARNVEAIYGELLVPLAGDGTSRLPGELDLSLAARHEWYSDFGQTTNPKLGVAWRPFEGLRLRGTYGTSFRAPGFGDLVGSSINLYQPLILPDPQSPTGSSVAIGLFGFAEDIGPEKAESWTAGIDLTDWPLAGLKASATYFNIDYSDRIGTASSDYLNFLTRRDLYGALVDENPDPAEVARYFADPGFSNPLGVTPGEIDVIIDGLLRNLSSTRIRGLDIDAEISRPFASGIATLGISGTRLFAVEQSVAAGAPATNFVSTLGFPVKLRLRARALWNHGPLEAGLFVNRTGSYQNQTVDPVEQVGSWTTADLSIGYRFEMATPVRSARVALTATNLFDKDPPYVTNRSFTTTLGFDPEQASPVGRFVAVQITIGW